MGIETDADNCVLEVVDSLVDEEYIVMIKRLGVGQRVEVCIPNVSGNHFRMIDAYLHRLEANDSLDGYRFGFEFRDSGGKDTTKFLLKRTR